GPSAPRRTDSGLPCSFTSNAAKVGPGGCTLCVLCHRSTRGALQTRRNGTRVRGAPIDNRSELTPLARNRFAARTRRGYPPIKKRNVYLCVHDGHIPSNRSASR